MKFDGVRTDLDATSEDGIQDAVGVRYVKEGELRRRLCAQLFSALNSKRGVYHLYNPVSGGFAIAIGNDGSVRAESI